MWCRVTIVDSPEVSSNIAHKATACEGVFAIDFGP